MSLAQADEWTLWSGPCKRPLYLESYPNASFLVGPDNVPWMKHAAGKRSAIPKIGGVVGDQFDQSDTKHLRESEQGPQRRVSGMAWA